VFAIADDRHRVLERVEHVELFIFNQNLSIELDSTFSDCLFPMLFGFLVLISSKGLIDV
jgi:hypothetical protein